MQTVSRAGSQAVSKTLFAAGIAFAAALSFSASQARAEGSLTTIECESPLRISVFAIFQDKAPQQVILASLLLFPDTGDSGSLEFKKVSVDSSQEEERTIFEANHPKYRFQIGLPTAAILSDEGRGFRGFLTLDELTTQMSATTGLTCVSNVTHD